jgi:trk system potassium uptake protein TrkA
MTKRFDIGVIGLGKFGSSFAEAMMELGHRVLGVDRNLDNINRCKNTLTQVFRGNAMEKRVLEQLGFRELKHVLVSVGDSITDSTMISMYLKELAVPAVWVKAVHRDHEKLLRKIGVTHVIIPEEMAAMQLANRVTMPGFIDFLPFDTEMMIREIMIDNWHGQTLRNLDLTNTYNIQVVAVKKANDNNFRYIPKADRVMERSDVLIVIGPRESLEKIDP